MGFFLVDIGLINQAESCHREALRIAEKLSDESGRSLHLCNLGARLSEIGQTSRATAYFERALAVNTKFGFRYSQALTLNYFANSLADQENWDNAIEKYNEAILIADDIGSWEIALGARLGLVLACISTGDLVRARSVAYEAQRYNLPRKDYKVPFLLGVIALRNKERASAEQAFHTTIEMTGRLLKICRNNYGCWEIQGLAFLGLSLSMHDPRFRTDAIKAFQAARRLSRDAGLVSRTLHILDLLSQGDRGRRFTGVRQSAAGKVGC